jgi:hypothetical protein
VSHVLREDFMMVAALRISALESEGSLQTLRCEHSDEIAASSQAAPLFFRGDLERIPSVKESNSRCPDATADKFGPALPPPQESLL